MVNFGPLAAEIVSLVWGTPANFNEFRVLAALLHSSLVVGVSQTLQRWQRAPPIYGRVAINLGICPHSSLTQLIPVDRNFHLYNGPLQYNCRQMVVPPADCRIGMRVQRKCFQWGRFLCVQISREWSYPLPIYWYHSKGNWLRYNFAAESFYIVKLFSRLFVLYCRNCPKDDKFRYFIPILRKLRAA